MGHSWVQHVVEQDDGSLLVTVELYGFDPDDRVHLSGQVTQADTAFARFDETRTVPKPAEQVAQGAADNDGGVEIDVTAKLLERSGRFDLSKPLSVVTTASSVWTTVLTADPAKGTSTSSSPGWGNPRFVG